MKDTYPVEVVICKKDTQEIYRYYKLGVNPHAIKPFQLLTKYTFYGKMQTFWTGIKGYYDLGVASRAMLTRANNAVELDKNIFIKSVTYLDTPTIVKSLPVFYKIYAGKVKRIR